MQREAPADARPGELLSFDPADWRGAPDEEDLETAGYVPDLVTVDERVMAAVAVSRWLAAREAFAASHGLDYVVTMIGGRCYRRLAFLDRIVPDPRDRQTAWDIPA